jgi:hypothetical protein
VTSSLPDKAGVEPLSWLIDRVPEDNTKTVTPVNGNCAVPEQEATAGVR